MTLEEKVLKCLSPDIRSGRHSQGGGLNGYCYVISEAIYHKTGGQIGPWEPHHINYIIQNSMDDPMDTQLISHWYLVHKETKEILDLVRTYDIPYEMGRRMAFLTKEPSKRARILLERLQEYEERQ